MNVKCLTAKEAKIDCQAALFSLGNKITRKNIAVQDIGEYIPGSVMVQDLSSMTNLYMNRCGCDYLRKSVQELKEMGSRYFEAFFPSEEINILKVELMRFFALNDSSASHSFFQRVRPDPSFGYQWYFTTSRLYQTGAGTGGNLQVMHVAVDVNTISYAGRKISNLCGEDAYIRLHYHKFCFLTKREKEIITLIVRDKNSYEIADTLCISIHTVNNHRKNIIAKLKVTSFSQLIKFAIAFDLI